MDGREGRDAPSGTRLPEHAGPDVGADEDLPHPTIYDVARVAGVASSTVSRALSKPGRVSYQTAERVRRVAAELGYRTDRLERELADRGHGMLAIIVADIANPVFFGMIRGAEQAATSLGFTTLVVETQESVAGEQAALHRLLPVVDGAILASSRMSDTTIRSLAKQAPLVLLNRAVREVPSVVVDDVHAIKKATEHLAGLGHTAISYLAGPEASWADGMRWRGLREAGLELDLSVRRLGPFLPTRRGGGTAAQHWRAKPTTGVIAYNDLMAIGFITELTAAGGQVPRDVSVVGFDNIADAELVQPQLTTIAAPLVSLGAAGVAHLTHEHRGHSTSETATVRLPARLVVRASTGVRPG